MNWLLTLILIGPEGTSAFEAGLMVDRGTCETAGAAMAFVLEQQLAGLQVGWSCEETEEA